MLFPLKSLLRFCFLSFVLISLVGCAAKTTVVPRPDDREVLEKRVREYWELMINLNPQNVENVYRYEAPSFRDKISFVEYIHRFKTYKYLEAEIKGVEIEGNKGKVSIVLTYRALLTAINKKLTKSEDEKWVKVEGTWYHIPGEWVMGD